jgi:PTH1 family peptidyl-tRNA hydrolase
MNESGKSVRAVLDFYKIPLTKVVAVHDELDIPFGQIRTRLGGSSAGHNGIKSIISHNSENFGRLRIGVGADRPAAMEGADFVLGKFSSEEQAGLKKLEREAQSILIEFIYRGELYPDTRNFLI